MQKKILVPVDFTELSAKVCEQAAHLGSKSGSNLVLLHIVDKESEKDNARKELEEICSDLRGRFTLDCEVMIKTGSIFQKIAEEAEENEYLLLVIGTHGIRGLKQKLMGADILKILTRVPVPSIVIQSTSETGRDFDKILLPVATHPSYDNLLKGVILLAEIFKSEVQVYSVERPGFEWPEQLITNLEKTNKLLEEHSVSHKRVREKQNVISVGFAKQTLQYAKSAGISLIAMMSVPSEEYHYFAQQDKENLLTNETGIPVLCACDKSVPV